MDRVRNADYELVTLCSVIRSIANTLLIHYLLQCYSKIISSTTGTCFGLGSVNMCSKSWGHLKLHE